MKVTLNIPYFLGALAAFFVAYMTVTYKIDQYIHFAGEENALGFFVMSFVMGVMMLFGSFERASKK
jgi:hypothetical protein